MRKIDFDFLMNDFCNPHKNQILIHAVCELKGTPYQPNFGAVSTESLLPKFRELCDNFNFAGYSLPRDPEFSYSLRNLIRVLFSRGILSENDLKNKVAFLLNTVYRDPSYINLMRPFL